MGAYHVETAAFPNVKFSIAEDINSNAYKGVIKDFSPSESAATFSAFPFVLILAFSFFLLSQKRNLVSGSMHQNSLKPENLPITAF